MLHRYRGVQRGFALPTVLIASVVLLAILAVSISATSAIRTTLKNQYYAQLAQVAGEAGVAYAKACLSVNGNVPQWDNAHPLTPTTDCFGNTLKISSPTVQSLVIAGGGGGGGNCNTCGGAGGGGAGGFVYTASSKLTVASYPVVVGAGGAGGAASNTSTGNGANGSNSSFNSIIAIGGGGGRPQNAVAGGSGGSGGGGSGGSSPAPGAGGAGTAGQGFAGGSGQSTGANYGGSGGGAGGAGANGGFGGGGIGLASSISGSSVTYASGGGTGGYAANPGAVAVTGGGGYGGGANTTNNGGAGTPNTGGGGGGARGNSTGGIGGTGGSGVVIIRYPTGSLTATGGTVTTSGSDTIHTFTSSGTFEVTAIQNLYTCPNDTSCFVTVNGNVRSSFSVAAPTVDANGKAVTIPYNGFVEITRTSNGAVWRTINQPSVQAAVVPDLCSGATNSSQGWNNAVRASTQDSLEGSPAAQSITVANTNLNAGAMYFRKDVNIISAGTYSVSVLTPSTNDIAEVYVGSQRIATSAGSAASGTVTLGVGCQPMVIKLTNSTVDPRISRVTASLKKTDNTATVAVTEPSWRVSTGDAVHYSSPYYYADPSYWVPISDSAPATNSTDEPTARLIGTPVAATNGTAYFRDNRTINVATATPIHGTFACNGGGGCSLYLDGELVTSAASTIATSYAVTLQPGDHKFAIRVTRTSGSPVLWFHALRDSDNAILSHTDGNWSTTNVWTTAQDYYSYDTRFVPDPNSFTAANVSVLVVGGGGGGGTGMGGGGGGGGVIYNAAYTVRGSVDVTVGAGGAGAAAGLGSSRGANGGNSQFGSLIAFGGGGGGTQYSTNTYPPGSGASAGGNAAYLQTTPASAILGQGNLGGNNASPYYPGGGGGAGGAGTTNPGTGGVGVVNDIMGTSYYWGGGGGGSGYTGIGGNGGAGGGGGGAIGTTTGGSGLNAGKPGGGGATVAQANRPGGDGGANTGGGGGGGGHYNANNAGGNGGSGIVVVSYPTGTIQATGGTITSVGCPSACRTVHTFYSSGTFQFSDVTASANVLVVAGGGSGGSSGPGNGGAGGGGAGGLLYNSGYTLKKGDVIPVTVGAGGASVVGTSIIGLQGGSSIFGNMVAIGGGGGGRAAPGTGGTTGGSGGGAGFVGYSTTVVGSAGTAGQGNAGGIVYSNNNGSGGGGAGGRGGNTDPAYIGSAGGVGGLGGIGLTFTISGSAVTYARGGDGATNTVQSGAANTGNGGSAGAYSAATASGAGGSGIVIVAYPTGSMTATGGTITTSGGMTIHTFTSSGTFTVVSIP